MKGIIYDVLRFFLSFSIFVEGSLSSKRVFLDFWFFKLVGRRIVYLMLILES